MLWFCVVVEGWIRGEGCNRSKGWVAIRIGVGITVGVGGNLDWVRVRFGVKFGDEVRVSVGVRVGNAVKVKAGVKVGVYSLKLRR